MPSDQRVGFDDGEGISPIEETTESAQSKTNGVCSAAGFDLSLNIETELFAQKEIFGCNGSSGLKTEIYECQHIYKNTE